jgi:hypothetical protein
MVKSKLMETLKTMVKTGKASIKQVTFTNDICWVKVKNNSNGKCYFYPIGEIFHLGLKGKNYQADFETGCLGFYGSKTECKDVIKKAFYDILHKDWEEKENEVKW